MQLISVHCFYILTLYWIPVWVLAVLEGNLLGFWHKVSYHQQRMRVWLLLCWFRCLLFLFVVWMLRLGLLVLCWIAAVIMDIPAMILTLAEKFSVFLHWEWYSLWVFLRYPYTLKSFDQERIMYFFKCFFSIYWKYHMVLIFF